MNWATRAGIHIDRAACAWLIRRHLDPDAHVMLVTDPADVPAMPRPSTCAGLISDTTTGTVARS